jgi:hypothetical protein
MNVSAGHGLDSPAATEVNNRLKTYLPQLRIAQFREIRPGIHFGQKGSTHVEVRVLPVGSQILVRSLSPVTIGTPMTQDLLQFLLTENANMLFGAFGIGPRNEIVFSHAIMATSLDVHELGSSVSAVVNTADKYDNQIVTRWGGKTIKQVAVNEFIAPALLKALLDGKRIGVKTAAVRTREVHPAATVFAGSHVTVQQAGTPDVLKAIKVNSVLEEYTYLARQRCACGGHYNRNAQGLLNIKGLWYDQLSVSCSACGNEQQFLFDINSFYGLKT